MNNQIEYALPSVEELKTRWEELKRKVEYAAKSCGRKPEDIKIISVTKTHPVELIQHALEAGITVFGENYAQELKYKHETFIEKQQYCPKWHFIGHLQTNKVKYIATFVNMLHSVDSVRLAREIAKQAAKNNRMIDILLQVNTSKEESKFGCEPKEIFNFTESVLQIENIRINGLMTIGSFSDDKALVRSEFQLLRSIREKLRQKFPDVNLQHLSMGMTGDYNIAIEEGATMVRVGTAIFGPRHCKI